MIDTYSAVLYLLISHTDGTIEFKPYEDYGTTGIQFCQAMASDLNDTYNKRFPTIKYTCLTYPGKEV